MMGDESQVRNWEMYRNVLDLKYDISVSILSSFLFSRFEADNFFLSSTRKWSLQCHPIGIKSLFQVPTLKNTCKKL